ncbi:FGGY-family carbohydrate kinase [Gordonia sp. NPDC003585]|uniref:FGGY-family carbohydrate kinase n=1 Tax=Gordonia sp. NPDC003585 TaxID=3154275 RepID=UPI0033B9C6F3
MSVVLGLHLQSDRVLAAVGPDGSAGESRQVFPASLRWPADTAPTLPHRRNHDAIYRHFVDHIGDPRPLSIPGAPDRLADDLAATLIATVVAAVESSRHEHVSRVLIAHSTYWTVAQLSSFHTSLVAAGLGENRALLLAPDIDVALGWIDHTTGLVGAQQVSVCDLRAESAIVGHARRPRSGHLTAVTAHGYPGLGVSRLDERLGRRVLARSARAGRPVPRHPALLAQVRAICAETRNTLHTGSIRVEVAAPCTRRIEKHNVTLHPDDVYHLARPHSAEIVRALQRCAAPGAEPDRVVLIGSAPRFPLLAEAVAARFGCPVIVPDDPEFACARGAALLAEAAPNPWAALPIPDSVV